MQWCLDISWHRLDWEQNDNSSLSVTARLLYMVNACKRYQFDTYLRSLRVNDENMPRVPGTNKHPRTIRLYTSIPHWSTILSADPFFQRHKFSPSIILDEIKGCLFPLNLQFTLYQKSTEI
jgi:hypothetical protein